MGTIDKDVVFPRAVKLTGGSGIHADEVNAGKRLSVAGKTQTSNLHAQKVQGSTAGANEVSTRTLRAGDSGKIRVEGTLRISGSIVYTPPTIDISASPFDAEEEEPTVLDAKKAGKASPFKSVGRELAEQKAKVNFLQVEEDHISNTNSDMAHEPWRRISLDTFESSALAQGWHIATGDGAAQSVSQNSSLLSHCGDGNMFLGGHCRAGGEHEISKSFAGLPLHKELRISARVHFIDSWDGEAAYMSIDGQTVWTSAKTARRNDAGSTTVSLCGDKLLADAVLGKRIDIVVPHDEPAALIRFGTFLDQHACDESFGIDDVALYVH